MKNNKNLYPPSVWLALAAVYVIWGSTYLAIRFAIETIPPFLMAGTRFVISGLLLYGFMRWKGEPRPRRPHWRSAAIIGFFLIFLGNGGVSWAEQKVPSGITALIVGIVPLWMVLLQRVWKREAPPGGKVWAGVALGMIGIVLLLSSKNEMGTGQVGLFEAVFLMGTSLAWSFGSLFARSAVLPSSALLATSMEMVTGGAMQLGFGILLGEPARFDPLQMTAHSMGSWVYLTLIGSLVGFTSYIWVLQKSTPALASTYAFVNPAIAVFLGWLLAGESLTPSLFLATGLIVAGVVLITLAPASPERPPGPPRRPEPRKTKKFNGRIDH